MCSQKLKAYEEYLHKKAKFTEIREWDNAKNTNNFNR